MLRYHQTLLLAVLGASGTALLCGICRRHNDAASDGWHAVM
jgi:hypothetical protein